MLSKEQLLAAKIDREKVELLGGFVYVRGMTGTELDRWEQWVSSQKKKNADGVVDNFRASLVVRVVCDETGKRTFEDGDVKAVGAMPAADINKLYEVGARLSGVSEAEAEELGKNLNSAQQESSHSG